MENIKKVKWQCNVKSLLEEILICREASALEVPIKILANILLEVAECATEINDPNMNILMLRLGLYEEGDPTHKNYNPKALLLLEAEKLSIRRLRDKGKTYQHIADRFNITRQRVQQIIKEKE